MVLNFIKDHRVFSVMFLLAAIVRFIPAFEYQFSYDELCGIRNSLFQSWKDMVDLGVSLDTHPILVQLIINFTVKIFGYSEFWIKLPFLLFSLAAILYAYLFSDKWFGRIPALLTAAIFSFSYIFLFYAPLARMYSGGLFFCTALTYYLFNLCFSDRKKNSDYILFVMFILLASLNNHLSCLYALSCGLFGLFFQKKSTILKYLGACVLSVLLYLPHLPITLTQLAVGGIGHGQDGWLPPPDRFALFSLIKTLFGTGYIWIVFVLLLVISVILKKARLERKIIYLVLIFLFNYAIIHLYSVAKAPIFQYSVMLFSAPCFIWAFTGMLRVSEKKSVLIAVPFCVLLLVQSLWKKDFFNNAVLNQNDYQSEKYCEMEDKYGKGKIEALYGAAQPYFVVHYEVKYKRPFKYHLKVTDVSDFKNKIQNSDASFFILGDPSYTELELVKEKFPFLIESSQHLNVNHYVFSKQSGSSTAVTDQVVDQSSLKANGNYEYSYNREKFKDAYQIDSLDEFPFAAKAELKKVGLKEGQVILAKIRLNSEAPLSDVGFNYSITNEKDSALFFGGPDLKVFYSKDPTGYWAYSEIFLGSEYKNWIKEESRITFFLWNRGKHKFTLSECEIKTFDYWPSRWSWWD
jgi:hypothetical protein